MNTCLSAVKYQLFMASKHITFVIDADARGDTRPRHFAPKQPVSGGREDGTFGRDRAHEGGFTSRIVYPRPIRDDLLDNVSRAPCEGIESSAKMLYSRQVQRPDEMTMPGKKAPRWHRIDGLPAGRCRMNDADEAAPMASELTRQVDAPEHGHAVPNTMGRTSARSCLPLRLLIISIPTFTLSI